MMNSNVFYRDLNRSYIKAAYGRGVYLYDTDGRKYLDGCGGNVAVNVGYGVEEIIEAIYRQMKETSYAHTSRFTTDVQESLAEKVIGLAPEGMSRVFFVNGGSEATETALKMARQFHFEAGNRQKYKVIGRWQSYHGNTIGALSMTGRSFRRRYYNPYLLNFPHIMPPYCYRCPFHKQSPEQCGIECACELERTINQEGPENISAFISEPVSGSSLAGVHPPKAYYRIIREICDRYEVLMIMDEVMTGFGRTGRNFGIDHWEVVPDMIAVGKGMTGGYAPAGGLIVHNRIVEDFMKGPGAFAHGHTYVGNPLTCAAALAVQTYIEKHDLINQSASRGRLLMEKLQENLNSGIIGDIRGKGLFVGVEFVKDAKTKETFDRQEKVAEMIGDVAFEKGLHILPGFGGLDGVSGDHILLAPHLIISESEIDELISILIETISEVEGRL
jgi:adenosylmethionine-8-amino-7-oxononanoate aminotransferase